MGFTELSNRKFGNADAMAYGAWEGDYFLFTADSDKDIPEDTAISISFYIRGSNNNALKNWALEYFDEGSWKTAIEQFALTTKHQEVTATATFKNAGKSVQFRFRCLSNENIGGDVVKTAPTVASRISKDNKIVIKTVEK